MRNINLFLGMSALFFLSFSGLTQSPQDQLKQIRSSVIEKIDGKAFYIHTIKRGQTLYMISKAYGVDINAVIAENPSVKDGIKTDQKIRIPIEKTPVTIVQTNPQPVLEKKPPTNESQTPVTGNTSKQISAVREVALMMPLHLEEVELLDPENLPENYGETFKSLQFVQFYEGFRMALDSLEKTGIKLKLFVYDVGKDTAETRKLLKKPELQNMDLIVGLLYHRNFQMVAEFAKNHNIPIVNPVSERSELVSGNPMVYKICPAKSSQLSQLAKYLEKNYFRAKILILRDGQFKDKEATEQLKKECIQRKLNVFSVESLPEAVNSLTKEKENVVVSFSNSTAYLLELSRRLFELRNEYDLTLAGMPSWDKIDGLEMEYMVGLHTHIMVPFFVDYQDAEVKKFVRRFHDNYKTDPEPLAFQGYDVAQYFLTSQLPLIPKKGMQTTFEFRSAQGSGFENQHWEIYKYENYRLIRVN